jgi:hypothetical protein
LEAAVIFQVPGTLLNREDGLQRNKNEIGSEGAHSFEKRGEGRLCP